MESKQIIKVKFKQEDGNYIDKEYFYYADNDKEVGQVVKVATSHGYKIAIITKTNIPESQVSLYKEELKWVIETIKSETIMNELNNKMKNINNIYENNEEIININENERKIEKIKEKTFNLSVNLTDTQKNAISILEYVEKLININNNVTIDFYEEKQFFYTKEENKEFLSFDFLKLISFEQNENNNIILKIIKPSEPKKPILEIPNKLEKWIDVDYLKNFYKIKEYIIENDIKEFFSDSETRSEKLLEFESKFEIWKKIKEKYDVEYKQYRIINKKYLEIIKIMDEIKYNENLEIVFGIGIIKGLINQKKFNYPLITKKVKIVYDQLTTEIKIEFDEEYDFQIEYPIIQLSSDRDINEIKNSIDMEINNIEINEYKTYQNILIKIENFVNLNKELDKIQIKEDWCIIARKTNNSNIKKTIETLIKNIDKIDKASAFKDFFEENKKNNDVNLFNENIVFEENKKIYFPLQSNEQQNKIVKALSNSNGVVVQGPPGTGKSHTIVNLVSHFMANGKRVLVTSQKEQALEVLRGKFPEELKTLCISSLSTIKNSKEILEIAIDKINNILTDLNGNELIKEIKNVEIQIEEINSEMTAIKNEIRRLELAQPLPIIYEEEEKQPIDLYEKLKKHSLIKDNIKYDINIIFKGSKKMVDVTPKVNINKTKIQELKFLREKTIKYFNDYKYDCGFKDYIIDSIKYNELIEDIKEIDFLNENMKLENVEIKFKSFDLEKIDVLLIKLKELIKFSEIINFDWQKNIINELSNKDSWDKNKYFDSYSKLKKIMDNIEIKNKEIDILNVIKVDKEIDILEIKENFEYILETILTDNFFKKKFVKSKIKNIIKKLSINDKAPQTKSDWNKIISYLKYLFELNEIIINMNNLNKNIDIPIDITGNCYDVNISEIRQKFSLYENIFKYNIMLKELEVLKNDILEEGYDYDLQKLYNVIKFNRAKENLKKSELMFENIKKNLLDNIEKYPQYDLIKKLLHCLDNYNEVYKFEEWKELYKYIEEMELSKEFFYKFKEALDNIKDELPLYCEDLIDSSISSEVILNDEIIKYIKENTILEYINNLSNVGEKLNCLYKSKKEKEKELQEFKNKSIILNTNLNILKNVKEEHSQALKAWYKFTRKIGKGRRQKC